MISVMIVEDEPPIQRSIKESIESSRNDFKVIACARHGKEAISLLASTRPDVIFTDIRMPIMDGLELMSYLSVNFPELLIVVISGYNDFNYVKKALISNAYDYLLKPISVSELSTILNKIALEFESRRAKDKKNHLSQILLTEDTSDNLHPKSSSVEEYVILILCAGSLPIYTNDDFLPAKDLWENINLNKIASNLAETDELVWIFNGRTSVEKNIILSANKLYESRVYNFTHSLHSQIVDPCIAVTISVSPIINDMKNIKTTLQHLHSELYKKIKIGCAQVLLPRMAENKKPLLDKISIHDITEMIVLLLKNNNTEALQKEIELLLKYFQDSEYTQVLIEKNLNYIMGRCEVTLNKSVSNNHINTEFEINEAICNSFSYIDLCKNLVCIFVELSPAAPKAWNNELIPDIIGQIEDFLLKNYSAPINSTTLSRKFGFVPAYLSRIYKTYKAISPRQYLTEIRISKAKEIFLQNPLIMAKEVSSIVGYSDPLYFSRVFKKETGFSPSEYQDLISKSK